MTGETRDKKCQEIRERFVFLWDDEGDPAERSAILLHIESCDSCTAEWDAFRETAESIREIDAEPTDDERREILEAAAPILEELRRQRDHARPAAPRHHRSRRLALYSLTAAAAAVLFFLAQNLTGPERQGLRSMEVVHYYETGGSPLVFGGADLSVPR